MKLYKCSEFQGGSGAYYVADLEDLGHGSGNWHHVPNMLGLNKDEYIDLLIKKFNAKDICYHEKSDFLLFCFYTLAEARKYKNWVNKEARNRKFYI